MAEQSDKTEGKTLERAKVSYRNRTNGVSCMRASIVFIKEKQVPNETIHGGES